MLEVEDIEVHYGIAPALSGVSLGVGSGEASGLFGPNGAGKTTLAKSIVGLLKPRSGSIFFNDCEITRLAPHQIIPLGISLAPEGRLLFTAMSVQDNLELGASTSAAVSQMRQSMEWVYTMFPVLKHRQTQAAGNLSGGEQQMLVIGRALMSRPQLLILDEPSLGLAPLLVSELFRSLKELNDEGLGILLVEQNMVQALRVCQKGYILESGKIVLTGSSSELADSEAVRESYIGV